MNRDEMGISFSFFTWAGHFFQVILSLMRYTLGARSNNGQTMLGMLDFSWIYFFIMKKPFLITIAGTFPLFIKTRIFLKPSYGLWPLR